jgi:hypothetical protein
MTCIKLIGVRTLPASKLSLQAGDIAAPATHPVTLTGGNHLMPP